jgi:hypothetical protein
MRRKQKMFEERRLHAAQDAEKAIEREYVKTQDRTADDSVLEFIRDAPTSSTALALELIPASEIFGEKLSSLRLQLRQLPGILSKGSHEGVIHMRGSC